MNKSEKEALVPKIRSELSNADAVVVIARLPGITVKEVTELRKNMGSFGAKLKVLKNTIGKITIHDSDISCLSDFLVGETAFAYSTDPIRMIKSLSDFAKESEKIKLLGGVVDGKFVCADTMKSIASLPPLEVLRGKIVGLLNAAPTGLVRLLKEPMTRVVRALHAKNN